MRRGHRLHIPRAARVSLALLALASLALASCSKDDDDDDDDDDDPTKSGMCFPDSDGLTGGSYTINLTVTDTGLFTDTGASKTVIATQNDSMITFTLTNSGTKPHGFEVECVSVLPSYPNLPAMCPPLSCFPGVTAPGSAADAGTADAGPADGSAPVQSSRIDPIAPGTKKTITFFTPTPDGLIYPFKSSAPDDSAVPGLNNGQWSLM
jgi:hypothetical protein